MSLRLLLVSLAGIAAFVLPGAVSAGAAPSLSADFACQPSCQVVAGAGVTFTATSNAGKPNYAWELSDETPPVYGDAKGPSVTKAFAKPGTYTVGLKVIDGANQQSVTVSHPVTVTAPTADFTCSPACTVDAGTTVTFVAAGDALAPAYAWDLAGRVPPVYTDAVGASATEEFDTPGVYAVALRETDAASGLVATAGHVVTVNVTAASTVRSTLGLATSPVGQAILGPEHEQPSAPDGPQDPPVLPADPAFPKLRIQAPHGRLRVGALAHVSIRVTAGARARDVAWDLDGDGQRNDAYGEKIAYPITCPGSTTLRAEVVDRAGLHDGDAVKIGAIGSTTPAHLATAMRRAALAHGALGISARYGMWSTVGPAFGTRPQTKSTIPSERTLRTDGSVGGSFALAPTAIGKVGKGWATSWRAAHGVRGLTDDAAGETATGVLLSPRFIARHRYVTFQLGGRDASCHGKPAETARLYVVRNGAFVAVAGSTATPGDQDQMHTVVIRVPQSDHDATMILAAQDASAAGHLNLGALANPAGRPRLHPFPVAGWADTHEHLDADQGFGGLAGVRTYMGVPGDAYTTYEPAFSSSATVTQQRHAAQAYATDMRDSQTHFAGPLGSLIMQVAHQVAQLPLLPLQLQSMFSAFHEQFQVIELHRAWEGGMRLISSLAISDAALQFLVSPADPTDHVAVTPDKATIEAHVEAMRQLAADNSAWMQIVYSPTEAHTAIADGRLAVVLGTEVDQLGSLGFPSAQAEVDWLWRIGIRQVTPIHAIDNRLGGAAVFQDVYDMDNDLVNRHDPAGNSTSQDSTTQIVAGLHATGIEARPDTTTGNEAASFGFFFHTTHANDCPSVNRSDFPNCVDFSLSPVQLLVGLHVDCVCLGPFGIGPIIPGPTPLVVTAEATTAGGGIPLVDDAPSDPGPPTGGENVEGLTDFGKQYIDALEHHGMLVDMEHMSDASINGLLANASDGTPTAQRSPAWQFAPDGCAHAIGSSRIEACFAQAYPFMSSHTSFRSQSLNPGQSQQKGYMKREFERTNDQIEYIDKAGGTIAPVVLQDPDNTQDPGRAPHHSTVTNPDAPGLNDCAGSSKSWAEAYLWALNHTINHRVALATDMAVVGGTGARFTPALDPAHPRLPLNCPASSANAFAGLDTSFGGIIGYLENPSSITQALLNGEEREERPDRGQYNHYGQTRPIVYNDAPIDGSSLRPDQPPLPDPTPPAAAGDFPRNFNYHGMVTIGQLPDLLQDVRNDGVAATDLIPLLHSAQAYLDMWDKASRLNGCLDDYDQPTSVDPTRCQGPNPMDSDLDTHAVCLNTCPRDPGDGSSLDPNGRPFTYTGEIVSRSRR